MNIQFEADDGLEWVALLNENTEMDLLNLNELVQKKSFKPREQALFVGKGLKDADATIIHHFSRDQLVYPDLEAGIFLSRKLVSNLWKDEGSMLKNKNFPADFNIDPAYEFAKYVYNDGEGVALENIPQICTQKATGCITFSRNDYSCLKRSDTEGMTKVLSKTLVAVKTCTKFHGDRLAAVMKTWGALVPHLVLVSDTVDTELGTMVLPHTVNTESGHCNKTLAILEYFYQQKTFDTLMIVDDDTILSVARLAQMLSCYQEDDAYLLGIMSCYSELFQLSFKYL